MGWHDVCVQDLDAVGAEGRVFMVRGGSPHAQFLRLSVEQLRDRVLGLGLLSERELAGYLALHEGPDFFWKGETIIAVWGRRPQAWRRATMPP